MSSSPTSTDRRRRDDAADGRVGGRGHDRRLAKRVGDWVEADETIVEISTDKVETEIPSPASGRVAEILVEAGATVDVGTVLARIDAEARPGVAHADEGSEPEAEVRGHDGRDGHRASGTAGAAGRPPVVRRIAARARRRPRRSSRAPGVRGRVTKKDVLAFIETQSQAEAPSTESPGTEHSTASRPYRPKQQPAAARAGAAELSRDAPARSASTCALARHGRALHDVVEADMTRAIEAARGQAVVPAVRRARDDRGAARVPVAERHARRRPAHGARRGQPGHRRVARRGRADRPGRPRRARALARGARGSGSATSRRGRATSGSRPTRCAAARSRSRTRARTAR